MTRYAEAKGYEKWRRKFLKRLYKYTQEVRDIVFIDETGFEPSAWRTHGWANKGQRVFGDIPSGKRPRTSLLGGYLNNKLIAPMLFKGTCDADLFNEWLKVFLLPTLKKGSIIVLDNASIHKSQKTIELAQEAECKLLFLPPYSPHLNPIEKLWGNIKRAWKNASHLTLEETVLMFV
jgi:transposase